MFDFDGAKLIIIGIVMLIVIKPKDLPGVMRQVGRTVAQLRRMAAEFQGQFHEAMREAELQDLKTDVETMTKVGFDPIGTVRNEIARTKAEIEAGLSAKPATAAAATAAPDTGLAATAEEAEQIVREESAKIAHDLPGADAAPETPIVAAAPDLAPAPLAEPEPAAARTDARA